MRGTLKELSERDAPPDPPSFPIPFLDMTQNLQMSQPRKSAVLKSRADKHGMRGATCAARGLKGALLHVWIFLERVSEVEGDGRWVIERCPNPLTSAAGKS